MRNKIFLISGQTGIGKTAISMHLAKTLFKQKKKPVNIVCADSLQIYKGLDILTNKKNHNFQNSQNSNTNQSPDFIK